MERRTHHAECYLAPRRAQMGDTSVVGTPEPDALARTELGIGAGKDAPTVDAKPLGRERNDPAHNAPKIPGYRITAVLGEGGMGTVYAAEQEAPRRRVAIKILQSRSQSALVRFARRGRDHGAPRSPGIARVLEAGEADGHPFLVMEHVDGTTLEKFAKALALRRRSSCSRRCAMPCTTRTSRASSTAISSRRT